MATDDFQALIRQAESLFGSGNLEAAREILAGMQRRFGDNVACLHLLALVEKKRGDVAAARKAFERALSVSPGDPQIANNYANLLSAAGERDLALKVYARVLDSAPQFHAARYNRALLLQTLGRHDVALADLERVSLAQPGEAKVHAAKGTSLRALRRLAEAAAAYDRAIAVDAGRVVAVHGRAVVAKERGEADASQLYRRALAIAPRDRTIGLGLAEALEAEGRADGVEVLAAMLKADPGWWEGHAALARMRWEAGEQADFASAIAQAADEAPTSLDGWRTYASVLAAAGLSLAAADVAAAGRAKAGEDHLLSLLEALHASEAGELARAERIYDGLPKDLAGRAIHESRHRLRAGDYRAAAALIDRARADAPWDIGAWAMTGVAWRLIGDERADWLLAQPGFVVTDDLGLPADALARLRDRLRGLHRSRVHPIGQSLRGGTQTRGRLFEREEPEILDLKHLLIRAVERYWAALPPVDATHPLLRHRHAVPALAGSWSVRLTDDGYHVAHMHPDGLLSSACYIVVPEPDLPKAGWLEIGGAPDNLDLPIRPLLQVEPRPGRITLFPSYCYHGTRPFPKGERLSVAFDVVAR